MPLLKENKLRTSYYLFKFKTAVHTVMAAMRFQYVVRRKQQYLHTYSAKIERQKSSTSNAATGASGFPVSNLAPATNIHGTIKPVSPIYRPYHTHPHTDTPIPPSTTSAGRSSTTAARSHSNKKHGKAASPASAEREREPQLGAAYLASLGRLQSKLNSGIN